ncbi:S24 family peptidase [Actinomadura rayongensis]|uniref:S26 family signal peptidase n=1 Tax=Actinomadura rayongensis TaxID=1429076 RepID=A0A6I4W835_9ACTN|nr:S24 family peptidase [Actinomadura rayongensis]MXQ63314.1 S26 family signal peptidase [Actinomadura rayongensis]
MDWAKIIKGRALIRAEVTGPSMLPALRPGDRLVVLSGGDVAAGDLVVARRPDDPETVIVKRATFRDGDGWWLESDNQDAPGRRDSWDFGAVPDGQVLGRAVARYRPLRRAGLLRRG